MNEAELERFRLLLEARRAEITTLSSAASDKRKPVELDQQSVGRLSRQDALQQQAMANAQEARRAGELKKIDAALARLDAGEFGYCNECGEQIVARRLEIDPTLVCCIGCAA